MGMHGSDWRIFKLTQLGWVENSQHNPIYNHMRRKKPNLSQEPGRVGGVGLNVLCLIKKWGFHQPFKPILI